MVVKEMSKLAIYRLHAVDTVRNELQLSTELMSPWVANLRYAFQDKLNLYMISEFMPCGDLSYYLHVKKKRFD